MIAGMDTIASQIETVRDALLITNNLWHQANRNWDRGGRDWALYYGELSWWLHRWLYFPGGLIYGDS